MYLIEGQLFEFIPYRLTLVDGQTYEGVNEYTDEQLIELGILPCVITKPESAWTEYYGEPIITEHEDYADVVYPVLTYTEEEQDNILALAKEEKLQQIASDRYDEEISGVMVQGALVRTDRESQGLITGAAVKAMQTPEYTCTWKVAEGFVLLNAEEIIGVADIVREHVQSCFDKEAVLYPLVIEAVSVPELAGINYIVD